MHQLVNKDFPERWGKEKRKENEGKEKEKEVGRKISAIIRIK